MRTISRKIFFIISQLLVGSIAQINNRRECCPKIFYEGSAFHGGVYNLLNGVLHNQYPVYKQDQGDKFIVNCPSHNRWVIADAEYTTWDFNYCGWYDYVQDTNSYCPQDTRGPWRQSDGSVVSGTRVRCSDCNRFPSETECATCCNKVNLASTNSEWRATRFFTLNFGGRWTATSQTINGKSVYRSDNNNRFCLWFNTRNQWMIQRCGRGGFTGYVFGDGPAGTKCPEQATGWRFFSQNSNSMIQDRTMRTTCGGGGGATCCSKVTLSSRNREWQTTRFFTVNFGGRWTATGNTINGKSVYKHINSNYCIWFNTRGQWMSNTCGFTGTASYILGDGPAGMECPWQATRWRFWSQNNNGWINDNTLNIFATC